MKKRILSLILALSMVLSVLPLGAFAEGSTGELVMDKNGYPVGTTGDGWAYINDTLSLTSGTFDFSSTHPQGKTQGTPTTTPVACAIKIESGATITGGTFNATVDNGTWKRLGGTISNGIFNEGVTNYGTIKNGTFNGQVANGSTGTISDGTFNGDVANGGIINNGTFAANKEVTNYGTINNGTFAGNVMNDGTIEKGTISGGTFKDSVINLGTINNGTFAAGLSGNYGTVTGGIFNGNANLTGVTGLHSITWDAASSDAKITEVNGVFAVWDPYVVVTESTPAKTKVVTITADTDIYSLNGHPIVDGTYTSSYPDTSKKTIVKFTMPYNENVVLSTGELVMEGGYPVGTSGKGWSYDSSTKTLTLSYGTFDFSSTHPQGKTPGTPTTTPVACAIQSYAMITGGTFAGSVANGGTIENGTFNGTVTNNGTISGGAFTGQVDNKFKINGGTFRGEVTNSDTITGNSTTFEKLVTNNGYIYNGTFRGEVTNNGTITGNSTTFEKLVTNGGTINNGTFAAGLSRNDGSVTGGVFNGKTGLTDAHQVTVTNGSVLKVNDEAPRKEDGTEDTAGAWNLYSYEGTTMTITADTEIFSLNGQPIDERNYPNKNDKTTVKFTMPGEKVVLSSGELVMAGGYPVGTSGKGWSYDSSTQTLTLTYGTFDFSFTYPQNAKGAGAEPVKCAIESYATITGGIFAGSVTNDTEGMISGNGTFKGEVKNHNGTISGGKFEGTVINDVNGTISDGTFNKEVSNINGNISNGTFNETVTNDAGGTIYGGTFAGGVNNKNDRIYGGVFNGNATLTNVTGLHSITVASGAKIKEVNDVSAVWDPYVVVTESTKNQVVTITASTEIYSLNGQPIGANNCNSSYGSNKNTVTFTMPDGPVVLNKAITCTDLVMKDGWPEASNGGTIPCKGTGWEYSNGTLILTGGTFNLSSTAPVKCEILLDSENAKITGGTFEEKVTNNGGTISDGTFNGTVENYGGTISSGTFKGTVQHWYGTISGGTFHEKVLNSHGVITGGTFAAGLSANNGAVTGGVFNGNTGLNGVTGLHSIKWDDAYPNAKIEKVNGVSAEWDPYVVVTEWTTATAKEVIITADTEIFSLNGQPIGDGNCNSSYGSDKTTVTFTMPDDKDVVLNKAIASTDLVMENGWPKDSNSGTTPCKGDGWQYIPNDPNFGDMLLLTGSNQTGGLYDFSTIAADGSAVKCNVFVGKPTAITGGEFNGKVFNNSGILGGTFNGEVENMGPGTINDGTFKNSVKNNGMIENGAFHGKVENNKAIKDGTFNGPVDNTASGTIEKGTFHGAVENNGMIENGAFHDAVENNNAIKDGTFNGPVDNTASGTIEKGTFHDAVKNDGIINGGTFNGAVTGSGTVSGSITGSGTLNGEPITKTPEPEPKPETKPEPKPEPNPEPKPEPNPEPQPEPEPVPTTYTVTVIGGTIDGKTSVSAKEKDTLTVVLDESDIPDGMTFDMWSISSDKLSGDINVDYRAEAMTFQMPAEDVTIRAQYRSAEIIEDAAPSPLATAATIAVGGAAAGIVVWQGVSLGVDLYLANALPQGVPVPTDRRALALLLWETAGKPEVALPTLYGDIPAEEIELQKATRWAVQNGLMDAADKKDASFFDPDHYVTKMDVFGAWLRLKKLLGTT